MIYSCKSGISDFINTKEYKFDKKTPEYVHQPVIMSCIIVGKAKLEHQQDNPGTFPKTWGRRMRNAPWSLLSLYFLPFFGKRMKNRWKHLPEGSEQNLTALRNLFCVYGHLYDNFSLLFSYFFVKLWFSSEVQFFIQKNTDSSYFLLSSTLDMLVPRSTNVEKVPVVRITPLLQLV